MDGTASPLGPVKRHRGGSHDPRLRGRLSMCNNLFRFRMAPKALESAEWMGLHHRLALSRDTVVDHTTRGYRVGSACVTTSLGSAWRRRRWSLPNGWDCITAWPCQETPWWITRPEATGSAQHV